MTHVASKKMKQKVLWYIVDTDVILYTHPRPPSIENMMAKNIMFVPRMFELIGNAPTIQLLSL